jgi:chaperonin GroEL
MKKKIEFNREAREKLQKGVDTLANAVKVTLGPNGRNVILGDIVGQSHVTKDGVTVAKQVYCDDYIENIGAQTVKNVAQKTVNEAGDGTTTATVLAQDMMKLGLDAVNDGYNPMDVKRGMDKATFAVVDRLKELSKEIESEREILQVATISANNDESIGIVVSDAMKAVKNKGIISVSKSETSETYIREMEGFEFSEGFTTPYFVNNHKNMTSELDNPFIIITDHHISGARDIQNVMACIFNEANEGKRRDVLFICDEIEGEALGTVIQNIENKFNIKICVVKAPYIGSNRVEALEDISIMTGGTVYSEKKGRHIKDFTFNGPSQPNDIYMLGQCEKIIVSDKKTVIMNGFGDEDKIKERISILQEALENSDNNQNKNIITERMNRMGMTQAVIHVGATTSLELAEKNDRYDDAICATRSAVEEGIVPGGGIALIRCLDALDKVKCLNRDEKIGVDVIKNALMSPLRTIVHNAGWYTGPRKWWEFWKSSRFDALVSTIMKSKEVGFGFNAKTGKFANLIEQGVIDPTKVTRNAIENASSISSLLITTECVIADLTMEER